MILTVQIYFSQETIKDFDGLKNIDVSSSPSQMLLDNAPSIIVVQPYVKAYNVNVNNIDDFSFDFTPLLIDKKFKGWEYYGYYDNFERYDPLNNLLKATFSLSVKKETNYSNATLGFRTNVITVYNIKKDKMKEEFEKFQTDLSKADSLAQKKAEKELNEKYTQLMANCQGNTECEGGIYKERLEKEEELKTIYIEEFSKISNFDPYKTLNHPLFSLDIAAAYNHIFNDTEFSDNHSGRLGIWSTLKFSKPLDTKTYKSFVNAFLFSRYIKDNYFFDKDSQLYSKKNFMDYGGRLQLEFNKFSFSYEFIKRDGDFSDERSVGLITYRINENLYLNGGFGKNFEGIKGNSFTLLGIAWGINTNHQVLDWNN
jgi:hypothetical protein